MLFAATLDEAIASVTAAFPFVALTKCRQKKFIKP